MDDRSPQVTPPPLPGQRERRRYSRPVAHGAVTFQWSDNDDKIHSLTARVRDRSENGLGLYCDSPVPSGITVWILDGQHQQQAIVQYSRPRHGRWKVGLFIVREERRRAERFPVTGEADLSWGFLIAEAFRCRVRVVNVSPIGALVETGQEIPVDARAQLKGEKLECMGYVRHCTRKDGKFLIGIQFAAEPMQDAPFKGRLRTLYPPSESIKL